MVSLPFVRRTQPRAKTRAAVLSPMPMQLCRAQPRHNHPAHSDT
jgi:hypothetical protein